MILAFIGFLVGFFGTWKLFRAVIGCAVASCLVGSAFAAEGRAVFVNDTETAVICAFDDNSAPKYPFMRIDQSDGGDHVTGQLLVGPHSTAKFAVLTQSVGDLSVVVQDSVTRGYLGNVFITPGEWTNRSFLIAWGPDDNYVNGIRVLGISEAAFVGWSPGGGSSGGSDALAASVGTVENGWWGFVWGCGFAISISMLRLVRAGLVDWTGSGG